ncbi:target of rapamycin [Actinidia rufa]|uniref:Target of rapamycin n=1 Tax=Actinidia rufa TaxID=165716 RepID=A0A7J0E9G6_9ERIC|nr:target of rapamycin [Actinidia rufa]
MMSRYIEVAEIVLRYLEHRDRLVRLSITSLLPRIAHFLRDRFVTKYLKICVDHILTVLKTPSERVSGFVALGEMAGALSLLVEGDPNLRLWPVLEALQKPWGLPWNLTWWTGVGAGGDSLVTKSFSCRSPVIPASSELLGIEILSLESPPPLALVAKLCEGTGMNANNAVIIGFLVTVGDLSGVGGFAMGQYIPELMPWIVDALLDEAGVTKCEVAVASLGQVVQSTGFLYYQIQKCLDIEGVSWRGNGYACYILEIRKLQRVDMFKVQQSRVIHYLFRLLWEVSLFKINEVAGPLKGGDEVP